MSAPSPTVVAACAEKERPETVSLLIGPALEVELGPFNSGVGLRERPTLPLGPLNAGVSCHSLFCISPMPPWTPYRSLWKVRRAEPVRHKRPSEPANPQELR